MSAEGFVLKHICLCGGFKACGVFLCCKTGLQQSYMHTMWLWNSIFWWYHLVMLQQLKENQRVPAQTVTCLSWKPTQSITEKLFGFQILGGVGQFYCSVGCFVFKYVGLSSSAFLIWSCCSATYFTSIPAPLLCAAVPVCHFVFLCGSGMYIACWMWVCWCIVVA